MTLPKISVITPSYNQGHFIEETMKSVLNSGYENLEYIIIDGGSTDDTLDVIKRYEGIYGGRLRWLSEEDEGQADAINKGISMATGDVIAYLNSDDLYEEGALRRVGEHFAAKRESMWLTGRCRIIDEAGRDIRGFIRGYKNLLLSNYSYSLLLVTNCISQPATFWRREVMDKIGLFDKEQHRIMDYDYWLRLGEEYPLSITDDYLASFRVYSESKTSSGFDKTFREELEAARRHSDSLLLNGLHYLSYMAIVAIYNLLAAFGRK